MATQSASKPPNVIPIPQNPTLRVPPGFVVNVFADNLDAPRWLAITAKGDVLVSETRQNRIRLLRDTNGDGIADGSKTFAGYHLRIIISSWVTPMLSCGFPTKKVKNRLPETNKKSPI
uniref:hypothetical protein n=1 Tax=Microseira wollei TaxID=467598 RepID=UPI001CFE69C5|nr:hypothetical protein [Microseira wollei]